LSMHYATLAPANHREYSREIKFHINRKEERFAFKPRPEQCSKLEWQEKQELLSRSPSLGPTDASKE